eukprot:15468229-Alexandrium_andersonii.AAC.1
MPTAWRDRQCPGRRWGRVTHPAPQAQPSEHRPREAASLMRKLASRSARDLAEKAAESLPRRRGAPRGGRSGGGESGGTPRQSARGCPQADVGLQHSA